MPRITFSELLLKGSPLRIVADDNESEFTLVSDQAGGAIVNTYDGEFTTQSQAFRFYFDGTFFAFKLTTNQMNIGDVSDLSSSNANLKLNTEEAILNRASGGSFPAKIAFFKNRSSGSVSNGDQLAALEFYGRFSSTDYLAGRILCTSDGGPGANDMPGRIDFQTTPDGTATPTTRYAITNGGRHLFGQPTDDGSNMVQINGATRNVGNIGAGVSPSVRMHIQGSSDSDSLLRVQDSTNTVQSTFGAQTTTTSLGYGGTLSAHPFSLRTQGTERSRWDTSNNFFHNFSTQSWTAPTIPFGVSRAWFGSGLGAQDQGADGTTFPLLAFAKKRSASVVAINDTIGHLSFLGFDGTNFKEAARIAVYVDATPGTNDMPGRIEFWTTLDGSSGPTQRMTIKNNGEVLIGTATAFGQSVLLGVNGGHDNLFMHTRGGMADASVTNLGQGSYVSWNRHGGTGAMEFINHMGGGAGGFFFTNTDGTTFTDLSILDANGHYKATNYGNALTDKGTVTTTVSLNWSKGTGLQRFQTTSATNITVSFTAPPNPCYLCIKMVAPAAGTTPTITWPTVKGGTMPATVTLAKTRIAWLMYDGTDYILNALSAEY